MYIWYSISIPQVEINKILNQHSVYYHPSLSELTSRMHPLIFLWTCKGFISPEYFLKFFSNLYIQPWLRKIFKLMMLKLLENTFASQKNKSVDFYSCPEQISPPGFYHHHSRQKEIIHFLRTIFFENLFFPSRKGGGLRS